MVIKFSNEIVAKSFQNRPMSNIFRMSNIWKIHHHRIFQKKFFFSNFWWVPNFARFAWKCFNKKLERFFGFQIFDYFPLCSLEPPISANTRYHRNLSIPGESSCFSAEISNRTHRLISAPSLPNNHLKFTTCHLSLLFLNRACSSSLNSSTTTRQF